jgi:hypothetical protein
MSHLEHSVPYLANTALVRLAAHQLLTLDDGRVATLDGLTLGWELADGRRLATPAQWRFVWTVLCHNYDPRCAALLGDAFASSGRSAAAGLTIGQYTQLRDLPDHELADVLRLLEGDHLLHRLGLLEPREPQPTVSTPWRVAPRLWTHLRGDDGMDPTVAEVGGVLASAAVAEAPAQLRARTEVASWVDQQPTGVVVLIGPTGSGRAGALERALAPRPVVYVDFARVGARQVEAAIAALVREATLRGAVPVLANLDAVRASELSELGVVLGHLLAAVDGPIGITAADAGLDLRAMARPVLRQPWPLPDASTRRQLWAAALADTPLSALELDQLAARYAFGSDAIAAAATAGRGRMRSRASRELCFDDVVAGVRDTIAERLGDVARRVEVSQAWDELVLAPEIRDDVLGLVSRVRHGHQVLHEWGFASKLPRGSGTAALFSGPPGTGKTMVAGLIARELQLDLYQIDLSKIVSKWVGETEKALARVFEAAEAGHALLLFDEADALFAKRSPDVKSAVDRYANLEVNYLLQRVESFGGVVILTTNLDTSLDPALRRRLAAHVVFAAPEYEERLALWRHMLATHVDDRAGLDCEELAREYEDMTGANIRNAVLAAAFLAAGEGRAIELDHLHRGGRGEYRSMGRVLSRGSAR